MDEIVNLYKNKVLAGERLDKQQALELAKCDLDSICQAANEIRQFFCQNQFDLCTIINGKSGRCSENCKYCAQAACHKTKIESHALLSPEVILEDAKKLESQGIRRYSIVTSGRNLTEAEVEQMCECIEKIVSETSLHVCGSFGLLDKSAFVKLKQAGLSRVHNNLETSRRYFPEVCTTHTWEDKIATIQMAKEAGLEVCSGGIMGIGETMEDRIDMALEIRNLGVHSVPVNMLNAIPGTPYEKKPPLTEDEMRRIVAVYRFLLPDAFIRLAGGRGLMADKGRSCMESGANAAISGDMLTTAGISIETDYELLGELGYEVVS